MNRKLKMIRKIKTMIVLFSAAALFSSCEKYSYDPPAVDPDAEYSFQNDIQPIFSSSCISCHGGAVPPDLREGKAYQSLTRGDYVDTPGESSELYTKLHSPSHTARVPEADKLRILYWINQGAENN